jgi:hypothetical protein
MVVVVVGCVCVNDIYKWGFGVVGIWELVMDLRGPLHKSPCLASSCPALVHSLDARYESVMDG